MHHRLALRAAVAVLLSVPALVQAQPVQIQRTFVASTGNDANPCNRTAPCRNFAAAVAATVSGGEVVVLDSAGYGPFTITSPVSVIAPAGVYAGITAFSGNAITVNVSFGNVVLRGLTLNGLGGTNGIAAPAVNWLHVSNCTITGFTPGSGLTIQAGQFGTLTVDDSEASFNGTGFLVGPGVYARFLHCRADDEHDGFDASSGGAITFMVVSDSASSRCTYAFEADGAARVDVRNANAFDNGVAFYANTLSAIMTVYGSTAVSNTNAFYGTGTIYTYGNNQVTGNVSLGSPTLISAQ